MISRWPDDLSLKQDQLLQSLVGFSARPIINARYDFVGKRIAANTLHMSLHCIYTVFCTLLQHHLHILLQHLYLIAT